MPIPIGVLAVAGAGAAGGKNWFATLAGTGGEFFDGVRVDSSGIVYNSGYRGVSGSSVSLVARYSSSGNVLWQRTLQRVGAGQTQFNGVDIDSSANIYVAGYTDEGSFDILLAKYNSSGALQWQRRFGSSSFDDVAYGIRSNASGDFYTTAYQNNGSSYGILVAKFNTNAVVQWQKRTAISGGNLFPTDMDMDSSENVYFTGQNSPSSGFSQIIVGKINSSGTIQWVRRVATGTDRIGCGVTVDSNGNVYVFSQTFSNQTVLQKWSSSGVLDWGRQLDGGSGINARSATRDSSDNVYVLGTITVSGVTAAFIAKYNSSGTIQWQRRLRSSVAIDPLNIFADANGFLQVVGGFDGGLRTFSAKLPNDGTGTGTFPFGTLSLIYEPSSLSETSISTGDTSGSTSTSDTTLSVNTTTYTDAASTLTEARADAF